MSAPTLYCPACKVGHKGYRTGPAVVYNCHATGVIDVRFPAGFWKGAPPLRADDYVYVGDPDPKGGG